MRIELLKFYSDKGMWRVDLRSTLLWTTNEKDCTPLRLSVNVRSVVAEAKQHANFVYWLEVMFTLIHRSTLLFPYHIKSQRNHLDYT
jgi:hypothetical protein